MSELTVANTDWEVVDDVKEALEKAAVSGVAVFERVSVTASEQQAEEVEYAESPIAIVRYADTAQLWLADGEYGCFVSLVIHVAAKKATEGERIEEGLRLKNAVVNAIETDPPANASGWGGEGQYHKNIEWGTPAIDAREREPWVRVNIPVEVGFKLASATSH